MSLVAQGGAFRVDGPVSEGGGDSGVAVTALTNGNFVVAWTQNEAGTGAQRIFWRLFDELGAPINDEQKIDAIGDPNSSIGVGLFYPSVAATADGGFAIGYTDAATSPSQKYEYWVTSFDAAGELVSGPSGNVVGLTENAGEIALTDPSMKAVTVYGTFNGVGATHLFVNGADTGIVCRPDEPSIAAFDDGGYVVSWVQGAAGADEIWAMYSRGGVTSSPFAVNTTSDGRQFFTAGRTVATLSNDGFVISWTSQATSDDAIDPGAGVYAQVYDANGVAVGGEIMVPTTTAFAETEPEVTALEDGGFLVAWLNSAGTGSIRAQRFDNDGNRIGAEKVLLTGAYPSFSITALSADQLVLSWANGSATYAQLFDLAKLTTGTNQAETIGGSDALDFIDARGEDDQLNGLEGDDTLIAGVGADTLIGGAGADSMDGGTGKDTASYRDGLGVSVNLTTGVHSGDAAGDVFISVEKFALSEFGETFTGGSGVDSVNGLSGDDLLSGGDERDALDGGAGSDILSGGGGRDRLSGDSEADLLEGGAANDNLNGGSENDTLVGGEGRDKLAGASGGDQYRYLSVFDSQVGVLGDLISGFDQDEGDQIDLSAIDSGILSYIGQAQFSGEGTHEVRVAKSTKGQTVEVDTDGDGEADMQITLRGGGITDDGAFVL